MSPRMKKTLRGLIALGGTGIGLTAGKVITKYAPMPGWARWLVEGAAVGVGSTLGFAAGTYGLIEPEVEEAETEAKKPPKKGAEAKAA